MSADAPAPRLMALFCDYCFTEVRGDFLVRTQEEGLTAIRQWARRERGRRVGVVDICPQCQWAADAA